MAPSGPSTGGAPRLAPHLIPPPTGLRVGGAEGGDVCGLPPKGSRPCSKRSKSGFVPTILVILIQRCGEFCPPIPRALGPFFGPLAPAPTISCPVVGARPRPRGRPRGCRTTREGRDGARKTGPIAGSLEGEGALVPRRGTQAPVAGGPEGPPATGGPRGFSCSFAGGPSGATSLADPRAAIEPPRGWPPRRGAKAFF